MGFLSFTTWQFAAAGALCAAGPLIIHLLNRRRYRVVRWAAMDFLRQALAQNRRILQIRDIILLVLRTLAVLLFGLALARPHLKSGGGSFDDRQTLHAILVIDNSLSMGYLREGGSLLDEAKDRARDFIQRLPAGSRVSIIPACGSKGLYSLDPYDTKQAAVEAVDKMEIVDRSASMARVASDVMRASESASDLAKRVVFISDQQAVNWRDARQGGLLERLPPMQVVSVAPGQWSNTSIADLRLQDGLADVESRSTIIVNVRHQGQLPRRAAVVTLRLGETVIGEKTIALESGNTNREVDFDCVFNTLAEMPEPNKPVFAPLSASVDADRLPADDRRFLAAPIVANLPVVFIDQYGAEQESVVQGRLGETRHLRKLLAPKASRADASRTLLSVRHVTASEVTQDLLADARLVVVAGLTGPAELVGLLRDFVRQGGQLFIAAGADFDPAAWNSAAWLEGDGILPLPLAAESLGQTPESATGDLKPFSFSFESLAGESFFDLAGVSERDLRDLYAEPLFFKSVRVDDSAETLAAWKASETARRSAESELAANVRQLRQKLIAKEAQGNISEEDRQALRTGEARLRAAQPAWLVWSASQGAALENYTAREPANPSAQSMDSLLAERAPRVLARYDLPARPPFLVSRRIGQGEVYFCSTGVRSSWNTLPKTNAVLLFDRVLRGMAESTLPRRNFGPLAELALPLPAHEQNLTVTLSRPGEKQVPESLEVSYIRPEERGVILSELGQRGFYQVNGFRPPLAGQPAPAEGRPAWSVALSVNGAADESDLTPLSREEFNRLAAGTQLRWVAAGEEISLAGDAIRGQNSWWWLTVAVLLLAVTELVILAWPRFQSPEAAGAETNA